VCSAHPGAQLQAEPKALMLYARDSLLLFHGECEHAGGAAGGRIAAAAAAGGAADAGAAGDAADGGLKSRIGAHEWTGCGGGGEHALRWLRRGGGRREEAALLRALQVHIYTKGSLLIP